MSVESYTIICTALFAAVIIAYLVTPLVIRFARHFGFIDVPTDKRRMHHRPVPLLGGLSIIVAFYATATVMSLIVYYFNHNSLPLHHLLQLLPGSLIIAVTSMFDDKYDLPALPRLLIQCLAAGITVAMDVRITHFSASISLFNTPYFNLNYLSIPITILWIVGMTNAVNWIDGLDGLAAGVSAIASFSILLIAAFQPHNQQLSIAVLAACLCGGCLGLLPYNRNPAKVFMGDTGAMFLGFTLAVISIQGLIKIYATVSFAVPLLILGLPLFDTASTILRRICKGVSPAAADRSHIHHKLIDLGLSQKQAVIILYSASTVLSIIAVIFSLYSTAVGWRFLIIGLLAVMVFFFILLAVCRRRNARAAVNVAASKTNQPDQMEPNKPSAPEAAGPQTDKKDA